MIRRMRDSFSLDSFQLFILCMITCHDYVPLQGTLTSILHVVLQGTHPFALPKSPSDVVEPRPHQQRNSSTMHPTLKRPLRGLKFFLMEISNMVHSLAAVMPMSQEVMEDVSQCMSVISVQAERSVVTKARRTTHRRYHSFDHPGAKMDHSSSNVNALQKSISGSLNPNWKLGDYLSTFSYGEDYAAEPRALPRFDAIRLDQMSLGKSVPTQRKPEIVSAERFDQTGTGLKAPSSQNGWRTGELCQSTAHLNRNDAKHVSNEYQTIGIPNFSSDFADWISSSRHLELTHSKGSDSTTSTTKRRLHLASLTVLTTCKLRSFSAQDASPLKRIGHLAPCDVPLSRRWREIQGAKNWNGLLGPLDLDLRKEVLRYGDFAQLTYDNFVSETRSKYAGSARFQKQKMFEKLHKQDTGYQVTRYLYATSENPLPRALQSSLFSEPWDVESNWMGFVAVATDLQEIERLGRRDIVVAWRGTARTIEWLVDGEIQMVPLTTVAGGNSRVMTKMCPKVEKGFWSLYTCRRSASQFNRKSASEQVLTELTRLLTLYKGEDLSITLTGHSLGGALSILTAYEIAERGLNRRKTSSGVVETIPVTVFTFGSPQVGNAAFRRKFKEMKLRALRVVEVYDLVPRTLQSICFPWMETYKHVGVELRVDHTLSPYLKRTRDPVGCHNMECYLHLVDGHQGQKSRSFALVTGRDYALVNKYADRLLEKYCIPPSWWQVENKGLELSDEGRWVEPNRALEDTPSLVNQDRFI